MNIEPSIGIEQIRFGMSQSEASAIWGQPDKREQDEHGNLTWVYQGRGVGLRFETNLEGRLGWIMVSNPSATIWNRKAIGVRFDELHPIIRAHIKDEIKTEDYGAYASHFFEPTWLEVLESMGWVTEINFGVPYSEDDDPIWPDFNEKKKRA